MDRQPTRFAAVAMAAAGLASTAVAAAWGDPNSTPPSAPAPEAAAKPLRYEDPSLVVVFSATDNDAQLFISTGSTNPMASLSVLGPGGTRVISARFTDSRKLGQADFRVDTPEPSLAELKRTYPPGIYRWLGRSAEGRRIAGTSRLSYRLLESPVITTPAAGASGLPTSGQTVRWELVPRASSIHLELEQPASARVLTVDLDRDATAFVIPDGFLKPGHRYVVDVKAVGANGNLSVADRAFRTG